MTQRQDSNANGMPPNLNQLPPGIQLPRNVVTGLTSTPTPEQKSTSTHLLLPYCQLFNMSSQAASNLLAFQQDLHNQSAAQQMLLAQQAAARMPLNSQEMPIYDLSSMATSAHVMSSNIPTTATSDLHQQSGNIKLPGNVQIKQEVCPSPPIMNPHATSQIQMPQYGKPLDTSGNLDMGPGMGGGGLAKHICQVCGDKASGKHYGVYSCEGCKGFFKRTVRKDLTYNCRDNKDCVIDKRQRNRCQYCRYHKCLETGMRREAVQEERQKNKDKDDKGSDMPNPNDEMPVDQILQAEILSEPSITDIIDYSESEQQDPVSHVCKAADRQLLTLVEWAKKVPHFNTLTMDDRVSLLQTGWNELFIASFSHRSTTISDGILLASGLHVQRESAKAAGVGVIFDRVLIELVSKMRDMKMDKTELGCLRSIVLFNPDARALTDVAQVESLREKVYASLEAYCRSKYPDQPGRFAKLLLRLPALRSIGLKCMEHLFFFKLIGNTPIDKFIRDMLETDSNDGENSINNQIRTQSESTVTTLNQSQTKN